MEVSRVKRTRQVLPVAICDPKNLAMLDGWLVRRGRIPHLRREVALY